MIGVERKELNKKARRLRNNMTGAEIILWSRLKSRQIDGFKFRRQQPVFEYIVDFYCHDLRLVIEIDGGIHSLPEIIKSDKYRDKILKINGFHVIRFTNEEIRTNLTSSIETIRSFIAEICHMNNVSITKLSPLKGDHRGSST